MDNSNNDSGTGLRVLVVDDNETAANTFGWMMQALGHNPRVALDGPSAIAAAQEFRPDVVMLDISLPGMSGYEVCERLRAQPEFQKTLLIAQTGWSSPEHAEKSRVAGFDYHLVKPVTVERLQDILNALIEKNGLAS